MMRPMEQRFRAFVEGEITFEEFSDLETEVRYQGVDALCPILVSAVGARMRTFIRWTGRQAIHPDLPGRLFSA